MRFMRLTALGLICLLAACTSNTPIGAGEPGPVGPAGAQGPQGAAGMPGPKGDKGDPGEVIYVDGGVVRGPPGESVKLVALPIGDAACAQGGVRLILDGGTATVCNGAPGAPGVAGPAGPQGLPGGSVQVQTVAPGAGCATGGVRLVAADGGATLVCNGAAGPQGPAGAAGPQGATGPAGSTGPQGAAGPAGPAGASVTITSLPPGDVSCPYGGARFTVGATNATACNGAPGSGGGGGGSGGDGGFPSSKVIFAGFTPGTYPGNLGGRAGANALCHAAFSDSHLCTNWEYDQAAPPGPIPSSQAWVDTGDSSTTTRFYRRFFDQTDNCINWTTSQQSINYGGNLVRGYAIDSLGEFVSTWVSTGNGGCQTPRALSCCRGGTAVRFRGFTPTTYGGNLGGRAGANALCHAAFSGSHFCSNWEYDQAAPPGPIPASQAWVDTGDSSTTTRFHRRFFDQTDNCMNWTTNQQNVNYGGNLVRGYAVDSLGAFVSTWVSTGNGGCQIPRALSCCD